MTVNRTTLLDLPLPVTGTEAGTWGDTTNNGLSQYMDIAIAGMNSLTSANFTAGALTIANTQGDSSATNIAAGSAQYATIKVSSLAVNSTITAPSSNRSYRIINADATYSLTIKASGQTGVTFLPGQTGVVAFNGTDYVIVGVVGAGTATDNAIVRFDGTTGKLVQNSVVTIADSTGDISGVGQLNATTVDATNIEVTNIKAKDGTAAASIADSTGVISITSNPVLSGGTANGVLYLNGSKVATSGSALTFDGTNLGIGTSSPTSYTGYRTLAIVGGANGGVIDINPSGGSTAGGLQIATTASATNLDVFGASGGSAAYMAFRTGTYGAVTETMRLTSTGLGIGTSSPTSKLTIGAGSFSSAAAQTTGMYTNGTSGLVVLTDALSINSRTGTGFLTLDSSGNLGLGVTPSAWGSGNKAIQLGTGSVATTSLVDINNNTFLMNGAYFDGSSYRYVASSFPATRYLANSGAHSWSTAPSGTAGNTISFTQAMTLDASGNLLVGTTTSPGSPNAQIVAAGTTDPGIQLASTSNGGGLILGAGGGGIGLYTYTGAIGSESYTERLRLDSSGNLGLGGSAARATTAGSAIFNIFNGTAPVGTLTNGISLYSSSGEAYVMDAAGNATLFSPHDRDTNEWIFRSKHTPSGKVLKIDVERLLRFVNDHFGLDAVQEFIEP